MSYRTPWSTRPFISAEDDSRADAAAKKLDQKLTSDLLTENPPGSSPEAISFVLRRNREIEASVVQFWSNYRS